MRCDSWSGGSHLAPLKAMANQNERTDLNEKESIQKLGELISGIRVAMLTTLNRDGTLHSRPMWTQKTEFDGRLWFFTGNPSAKIEEIQNDSHVTAAYSDPKGNTFVSVYGRGRAVQDKAKAKELWDPSLEAWFPQGLDDPNLGLICVDVERAEYWDTPSSKVVHLIGFAKARLTGEPYKPGPEQHGKLDIAS